MNFIKVAAAVLMSAFALNAAAQLTVDTESYSRVEASFLAQKIKTKNGSHTDVWGEKPKGFALGYIHGFSVTHNLPIFVELGGRFNWSRGTNEWNDGISAHKKSEGFMSVSIPVQAAYKFTFASSDVSIVPFFGPNFRFNFYGREKHEWTVGSKEEETKVRFLSDADAKVFQFGLNLGAGVNLGRLYLGYAFQPDLSNYIKVDGVKVKSNYNLVSVGINF